MTSESGIRPDDEEHTQAPMHPPEEQEATALEQVRFLWLVLLVIGLCLLLFLVLSTGTTST